MNGQQIDILMLGGKRCGKTTVLASMVQQIGAALNGTGLYLEVLNPQTREKLDEAISSLREKLNDFNRPLTRVKVDENPTSAESEYAFMLHVNGGRDIPLRIHDIPGEWLVDEHAERVKELVSNARVIIIAIDTPYLFAKMTDNGYGIYHKEYNKSEEIANFFKETLSAQDIQNRMIMFVPIKCERYYHLTHTPPLNVFRRNYMTEIVDAVGSGYRDLIQYIRTSPALLNSCTIAIVPILSAGGIDFVRFEKDEETDKMVSLYQKPEFLPQNLQGYRPYYCEQPMVYSLAYIMTLELEEAMQAVSANGNIFGVDLNRINELRQAMRLRMARSTGNRPQDGFYFIQNPKDL